MIVLLAFLVILVIVVIAAGAKKKKLNSIELNPINVSQIEESQQISSAQRSSGQRQNPASNSRREQMNVYSSLLYYVSFEGGIYGPFDLNQLRTFPLLEDTLVTTNTLNGTWYEARYFECLDDIFDKTENLSFRIDPDGVIVRLK